MAVTRLDRASVSPLRVGVGLYDITFTEAASETNGQAISVQTNGVGGFSGVRVIDCAYLSTTTIQLSAYWAYDPPGGDAEGDPTDVTFSFIRIAD